MAIQKMNFTKVWTNPADFPTYESQETKVRADMQLLFDELRDAHNALIDELKASEIPFTPTVAIAETNMQAAIENVQRQIAEAISGAIPDDSLTGDKMVEGAVDTRELADDAVTNPKIADDSVDHPQLRDDAVWGNNIKDGEVTNEKLAPNILPNKADLDDEGYLVRAQRRLRLYTRTITNGYTLTPADAEAVLYLTNAASGTVTLPVNALINDGAMTVLVCANSQVTIAPGSGASLFTLGNNTSGSIVINKKNTVVLLFKVTNTVWFALVPGVQDGQVSGSDIAPGAVDTEQLATDSVTLDKMANNSVDTDQLVDGAVTPEKTTGLQKTIYKVDATLSKNSWSNKSLTVSGISKDGVSIAAGDGFVAAPNNVSGWKAAADAMLYPPSVGDGTLTFTCETLPKDDIPITVYFWKE